MLYRFAFRVAVIERRSGWVAGAVSSLAPSGPMDESWTMLDAVEFFDQATSLGLAPAADIFQQRTRPKSEHELIDTELLSRHLRKFGFPFQAVRVPQLTAHLLRPEMPEPVEFMHRGGLFASAALKKPRFCPPWIAANWAEWQDGGKQPFALSIRAFEQAVQRFRTITKIEELMLGRDPATHAQAFYLAESLGAHSPQRALATVVADELRDVVHGVRFTPGQPPDAYTASTSVMQAIYADFWDRCGQRATLRRCARVTCGNPFRPSRPRQKFCCRACLNADKQSRYDAKRRHATA
jgi:hypothetical protein